MTLYVFFSLYFYFFLSNNPATPNASPTAATPIVLSTAAFFIFFSFISSAPSMAARCNSFAFRLSGLLLKIASHLDYFVKRRGRSEKRNVNLMVRKIHKYE